ncbi:MAG: hypothetical protein P5683_20755, partial [Limnospira sp. PMC 1279.21]|nr:hypothetical protein [Limnospira sp. PMC 1243.20]MDT9215830.1 hypothetical protein [Limnospira sp. PMC 1256.20]MDT9221013.1 hypothetical protein [Limnospira sp. PMC 1240.20]MDT9226060.1 hypothetical protein [Limnospira sp. PMC 1279.21]MDT9250028.1 hypothetical protein [Limnospira sp. PMC 1280.21]MDT9261748.1 hypothetical protein [Limnospira sp. PMC 1236.20]MDT9322995.1 hypothetical protein [Limnospira sp. PMC 1290.21]MDT9328134.1 hypothetical protein [Limnospira sp. PMC 1286.21]
LVFLVISSSPLYVLTFLSGAISAKYSELHTTVKQNTEDINRLAASIRKETREERKIIWLVFRHIEKYLTKTTDDHGLHLRDNEINNNGL